MPTSTTDYLDQINLLGDIPQEVKSLMVEILIYEKQIEDGTQMYAYKAQLNQIIDKVVVERLENEN